MKRPLLIVLALLLAAVVVVVIQSSRNPSEDTSGSGADPSGKGARSRSQRVVASPADAAQAFADLLSGEERRIPRFREVERWARKLDRGDLDRLLESLDTTSAEGIGGWVRSALFAEWARRDPQAVLAHLVQQPIDDQRSAALSQAWYALFRAWGEGNPTEAYEAWRAVEAREERLGEEVTRRITASLVSTLAREDAKATWDMISSGEAEPDLDLMGGFFAGLRDEDTLQEYLALWNESHWDTDQAREAHAAYDRQLTIALDQADVPIPSEEAMIRRIAGAWADLDLEGTLDWLAENGPGNEHHRHWRASQVTRDWARHNPSSALSKLRDESLSDQRVFLAHGIIAGDPALATEVVGQLDGYNLRAATLLSVLSDPPADEQGLLPDPRTAIAPPDPAHRYLALREAIESAELPERKQGELLTRLHTQYRDLIPEAQAALDALQAE